METDDCATPAGQAGNSIVNLNQAKQIAAEFPNVAFQYKSDLDQCSFADPRSDAVTDAVPLDDMTDEQFIQRIEQASREFAELHGEAPYGWATCRGYRTPEVKS